MKAAPKITAVLIEWVISGTPHKRKAPVNSTLGNESRVALETSGNLARSYEEWQIRDANGVLLETNRSIADFNFKPGARLFLSLAVGAGG